MLPLKLGTLPAKSHLIQICNDTNGVIDGAIAVPISDTAMTAIPVIMAGFLATFAKLPPNLDANNNDIAGADVTMPFEAELNHISLPYKGIDGITSPTPMNSMN